MKARSELGKKVMNMKNDPKYVDACKAAKGSPPIHGHFLAQAMCLSAHVSLASTHARFSQRFSYVPVAAAFAPPRATCSRRSLRCLCILWPWKL